jgi:N-acetylglucosamine-6-phosphate deacetylase
MTDLLVRGGNVLTPTGWLAADVVVRGGRITEIVARSNPGDAHATAGAPGTGEAPPAESANDGGERGLPVLDASGLVVTPGLIDLQCNGAGGIDLTAQPQRLWEVAALLPRWGVTAWVPTIVTSPEPVRRRAVAALRAGPAHDTVGAQPLGLHFEGPYLAPARRGAHALKHLRAPDRDEIAHWSRDAGVAIVTLAPELPGGLDMLRDLVDRGVVVSLGHSSATAAEATSAVDAGARWVTHLFNAMAPLHHREAGLAGVALTDERLAVGLIADGLHVDPLVVAIAARSVGSRLTLVTDAVAALGMPAGRWALGDIEARSGDDGVRLADGTLAGSLLSLDRAVANLTTFTGAGLDDALTAASSAPARLLGVDAERGVLAPGARGDLVLLDHTDRTGIGSDSLEVAATIIGGVVAHRRSDNDPGSP